MKSWPAGEVVVGVAHALVEVGLAVAVEVVQAGDLVAAQDVDLAVGHDQPERLVQARGEPPPADRVERVVEPVDAPDVALHRAEHGRPVGQEVVVAEEQQGVPGVLERRLDRVDRVGPAVPERPPGRRAPAATAAGRRGSGGPAGDPSAGATIRRELAVLDPGGVEHLRRRRSR